MSEDKKECLSELEYKKLETYLLIDTDYEKLGILIALKCGLRLGELCALTFDDINMENMILSVNKTLKRTTNSYNINRKSKKLRMYVGIIKPKKPRMYVGIIKLKKPRMVIGIPKNQKPVRSIPLSSSLCNIIKPLYIKNCYVATGNRKYLELHIYQSKFKKHLKKVGIRNINFYALRHTFISKKMQ